MTGTWLSEDRVRYDIAFESRGRVKRLQGELVRRPRAGDKHDWKYVRLGLALGGRLAIDFVDDAQLCAVHLPANLGSDGGSIVLAKVGTDLGSVRARITAAREALGLNRAELDELGWADHATPTRGR